jgi:3-dehydroquinate synthase
MPIAAPSEGPMQPVARADVVLRSAQWSRGSEYEIIACENLAKHGSSALAELLRGRRCLVCTTPTVHALYGGDVTKHISEVADSVHTLTLPVTEAGKGLTAAVGVIETAASIGLRRRDIIVALGGGVCSDVVRTAASMFRRGIPHVCIPTTLVGQIDAAIGAKGALNFSGSKSLIGTFHPPAAVLVDVTMISTLPAFYVREGFAEVFKLSVSIDCALFELVECRMQSIISDFQQHLPAARHIVYRSIDLTMKELTRDPFETGDLSRLLDFGHTFSPVLESQSSFRLSHGQAVAIDICLSAMISAEIGWITEEDASRIVSFAQRIGLPTMSDLLTPELLNDALIHAERHRDGVLNLVLPADRIGKAAFVRHRRELQAAELGRALERLLAASNTTEQAGAGGEAAAFIRRY